MKVKLLREGAKMPERAHPTDAGADVFYCPNGRQASARYDEDRGGVLIPPRMSVVIPTGISVAVPVGYMWEIKNKSGIASKQNLVVGACVIDSDYRGEIYINLHNIGVESRLIMPGQKIAQGVLIAVNCCEFEEVKELNDTVRGSGGFGSTGV
jgi:dUTP pyrophosphatase